MKSISSISTCIIENIVVNPLLSVVIPTFRRPQFLNDALHSIISQKTDIHFEVVIIDNDSEKLYLEHIVQIVKSKSDPRISLYCNKENIGMFRNWNAGVQIARGEYVTILNDDDVLKVDFVNDVIKYLKRHSYIQMLSTSVEVFGDKKASHFRKIVFFREFFEKLAAKKIDDELYQIGISHYYTGIPHFGSLGVVFKRTAFDLVGGFNESMYPIADIDFTTNMCEMFGSYRIFKYYARYRIHQNDSKDPKSINQIVSKTFAFKRKILLKHYRDNFIAREILRCLKITMSQNLNKFWENSNVLKFQLFSPIWLYSKLLRIIFLLLYK